MNFFTTSVFLETAGELFFPGRQRKIEMCRLEGRRLPMLVLDGHEVVGAMNFYDFPQPLDDRKGPVDRELLWLPRTVIDTMEVTAPVELPRGKQHAPYINWRMEPSWSRFEEHWKLRVKANDSGRQRRRIERELGPIKFDYDDPRPEVFDACITWKAAQYRASGYVDLFANPVNVELFRKLHERKALVVSSLSAGSTLMAVHFGTMNDKRFGSWIPSYDAALQKFSPGRLLLEEMMKVSWARGDLEFDFLIGNESYKFQFATHSRIIGEVGSPPLAHLIKSKARLKAKAFLEENPKAKEWFKKLRSLAPGPK